jgi:hypothetical protein
MTERLIIMEEEEALIDASLHSAVVAEFVKKLPSHFFLSRH